MPIKWVLFVTPVALAAAAILLAMWVIDGRVQERHGLAAATAAFGPAATTGALPAQVPATVETPLGELLDASPPGELTHLVGRRVRLVVDSKKRFNDIAFWIGTPPDDLLVVVARDTRSERDHPLGRPSGAPFSVRSGGEYITVSGVIRPVPYPEAMFSWGLTRRDAALLEQRGVYVHLDTVVSRAPHITTRPTAEAVEEWGRETAPPRGEQVETQLGLAPPPP